MTAGVLDDTVQEAPSSLFSSVQIDNTTHNPDPV